MFGPVERLEVLTDAASVVVDLTKTRARFFKLTVLANADRVLANPIASVQPSGAAGASGSLPIEVLVFDIANGSGGAYASNFTVDTLYHSPANIVVAASTKRRIYAFYWDPSHSTTGGWIELFRSAADIA